MARQKRLTHVFEVIGEGNYQVLSNSCESTADAKRWIRDNAAELEGKKVSIGSMTETKTVKVKTTAKVTFE